MAINQLAFLYTEELGNVKEINLTDNDSQAQPQYTTLGIYILWDQSSYDRNLS